MLKSFTVVPQGVCSKSISFDIDGDIVINVKFVGGCPGNLQAVSVLVEGLRVNEVVEKLSGIRCGNKETSCPDQLAKAIKNAYIKSHSLSRL